MDQGGVKRPAMTHEHTQREHRCEAMRHSPDARIHQPDREGPAGLRGPAVRARLRMSAGVSLVLDGVLRPVIGLRQGGMRGRALRLTLRESGVGGVQVDPAALNTVDAERLDLAIAEHAFGALQPSEDRLDDQPPPLLFLPVTWSTARSPSSRRRLLRRVAEGQLERGVACVCEVVGLDEGAPGATIREAAGGLTPIFRGVLARIEPSAALVARLADCGLSGVAVEAGRLDLGADPEALARRVLSLQTIGPGVMAHGVRSVAALSAMRTAGASWASLDIQPGARETQALLESASAPIP